MGSNNHGVVDTAHAQLGDMALTGLTVRVRMVFNKEGLCFRIVPLLFLNVWRVGTAESFLFT